jgi:hypothetical protein
MASEPDGPEASAYGTLALLQTRLRRLEFLVRGNSDGAGPSPTIPGPENEAMRAKLDALEMELTKLKRLAGPQGSAVREVDRLCMLHERHALRQCMANCKPSVYAPRSLRT